MIVSSREKLLFALTAAAILLMLGDSYVVSPFLTRSRETSSDLAKAESDLASAQELIDRKDDLARRWRWERLERGILGAEVPTEEAAVVFLGLLRKSAEAEGLKLENVQPVRGASKHDGEERVTVELKLRCPLPQLSRLLYRLGAAKEMARIDGLRITRASDTKGDLNAVVRVSMAVFRDSSEKQDKRGGRTGRNGRRTRR